MSLSMEMRIRNEEDEICCREDETGRTAERAGQSSCSEMVRGGEEVVLGKLLEYDC
jgi:hypothetical protein